MFVITDGDNNYVRINTATGEFEIVNLISRATEFTETKAKNTIKNNLKNHVLYKRRTWRPFEIIETVKTKEALFPYEDVDGNKLKDSIVYLQKVLGLANSNASQLSEKLSAVDREQTDILHFIENSRLNAAQWCSIGKQLQEVRVRRRNIKNQLRFNQLASQLSKDSIWSGDVVKNIEAVQLGVYTPRILTDLFKEGGE